MNNMLKVVACIVGGSLVLKAQTATVIRDGSIEIGVAAGDTLGGLVPADIPLAAFNGFHVKSAGRGILAISVAIAGTRSLLFYGQFSGFKGARASYDFGSGYSATTNLLNIVYEGGFERLFPIRRTPLALYALGAAATVQKRVDVIVNYTNPASSLPPTDVLGGATRVRLKKATFAPAVGGGLRCYVGRRFGFRLEVKSYFPTADVVRPTGVASGGIFVAFPGRVN